MFALVRTDSRRPVRHTECRTCGPEAACPARSAAILIATPAGSLRTSYGSRTKLNRCALTAPRACPSRDRTCANHARSGIAVHVSVEPHFMERDMSTTRRQFFGQAGAATLTAAAPTGRGATKGSTETHRRQDRPIWIDGLSAVTLDTKGFDALARSSLTMISTTVGTALGPPDTPSYTFDAAVSDLAHWQGQFARHADRLVHVRRTADVLQAHRDGKTAVMINFQNATHLNRDIRNVQFFYDLGVRQIQLTYNELNSLGAGCTERGDVGRSYFGIEVIEKMNELGILVDLSHCGAQTTLDGIEASKKPVLFTHTNCRALNDHPRCKTDEQIRKLAAKGGIVGITTYGTYVSATPPVTLDNFIAHVEHAVALVGVDHVAIGSDTPVQYLDPPKSEQEFWEAQRRPRNFRPVPGTHWADWIEELNGPDKFATIQRRLQQRGFSSSDVDKVLGGNLLRIYGEILG
jgi:membrane dipeptidase